MVVKEVMITDESDEILDETLFELCGFNCLTV